MTTRRAAPSRGCHPARQRGGRSTRKDYEVKYYVTWKVDGPAMLTVIDGELDLALDRIMETAFEIEEIEPDLSYEICSIIRAKDAEVIW